MLRHVYLFLLALGGIQLTLDVRATVYSGHDLRIDFKTQFLDAEIFSFASQSHYARNDRDKPRI